MLSQTFPAGVTSGYLLEIERVDNVRPGMTFDGALRTLCDIYPKDGVSWCVPGIFDGEREVISCYVDGKIAATVFFKKDETEFKISILYVKLEYQKRGVATALVERCFEWLGTTKPLITIVDYKLDQFSGIIKKYGWEKAQVLDTGYYNDHSREHVFNGII